MTEVSPATEITKYHYCFGWSIAVALQSRVTLGYTQMEDSSHVSRLQFKSFKFKMLLYQPSNFPTSRDSVLQKKLTTALKM